MDLLGRWRYDSIGAPPNVIQVTVFHPSKQIPSVCIMIAITSLDDKDAQNPPRN